MVHYDTAAVRQTPVLCPKCGSHRTEIVGTSIDESIIVIRCNACGARTEIPNPDRDEEAAAAAHMFAAEA